MHKQILFVVAAATIAFAQSDIPQASQANITDFEIKGLSALFELSNLTNHIPESFILNKRRAKDVLTQIQVFDQLASTYITAGGFVTAFLDLIDSDEDVVYLLKSIDMRLSMLLKSSRNYTSVLPQWLGVRDATLACLNSYTDAINRISDGIHKLYLYVASKSNNESPFIVQKRLDAFRTVCQNNKCTESTSVLLSGLNGGFDSVFKCDLVNILYQGLPGQFLQMCHMMQKGQRDMVTPYGGFLVAFTATSLLLESSYESLQTVDVRNWLVLQSRYQNQLRFGITRIKNLDKLMRDEMISNVHITVDRAFQAPNYYKFVQNYNDSIEYIYQWVNSSYTDYHWIMTIKNATPRVNTTGSADYYYYNCQNCFTTVDPDYNTWIYDFLIAGVPSWATPNTNYLQQKAFSTASNKYPSAKGLANYIFNGFCLAGVEAVSMYEDLEDIYPIEWNGVSERTNTNDPDGQFTVRFWSYQEDCKYQYTDDQTKDMIHEL